MKKYLECIYVYPFALAPDKFLLGDLYQVEEVADSSRRLIGYRIIDLVGKARIIPSNSLVYGSYKFKVVEPVPQESKDMYIIKKAPENGKVKVGPHQSNKVYGSETEAVDAASGYAETSGDKYIVFKAVKSVAPVRNVTVKDI